MDRNTDKNRTANSLCVASDVLQKRQKVALHGLRCLVSGLVSVCVCVCANTAESVGMLTPGTIDKSSSHWVANLTFFCIQPDCFPDNLPPKMFNSFFSFHFFSSRSYVWQIKTDKIKVQQVFQLNAWRTRWKQSVCGTKWFASHQTA